MGEEQIPDHILKALEWTKEWSTWLVGIDIAIIGGIVALGAKEKSVSQVIQFRWPQLLKIAIYLFVASIGFATFTLGGIPYVVQQLTPEYIQEHAADGIDVFKIHWTAWMFPADLEMMNLLQQLFFILGVLCIGINMRFSKKR